LNLRHHQAEQLRESTGAWRRSLAMRRRQAPKSVPRLQEGLRETVRQKSISEICSELVRRLLRPRVQRSQFRGPLMESHIARIHGEATRPPNSFVLCRAPDGNAFEFPFACGTVVRRNLIRAECGNAPRQRQPLGALDVALR